MSDDQISIYGVSLYNNGKFMGIYPEDDLESCRNCSHMFMYHAEGYSLEKTGCDPMQDHECKCKEFIPDNNLKYLEWKYNKNQKDKINETPR